MLEHSHHRYSAPDEFDLEPGHFTGGITAEQVNLLTGQPAETLEKDKDFGQGVCPNCGKPGKPAKEA